MNPTSHNPGEDLTHDAAPVARLLDRLCAQDRASIPAGLSERVYHASLPALRHADPPPAVLAFPRAAPTRRGLVMAAALALLATVSAAWLAGQHSPAPVFADKALAITDPGLEEWLALAVSSEPTQADTVDKIAADADELTRALTGSWMPDDLFYSDRSPGEESM